MLIIVRIQPDKISPLGNTKSIILNINEMKKIIVLFFLLGTILCYGQSVVNYTKYDFGKKLDTLILEAGIPDSVSISIVYMPKHFSDDYDGLSEHMFSTHYAISLKRGLTKNRSKKVICHEMVHIRDLVRGDLKLLKGTNVYWYKGEEYHIEENSTFIPPFETEAYKEGKKLYRKIFNPIVYY